MIFCTDVLIQRKFFFLNFNSCNFFLPVTRILLLHGEVTLGRQWIKRLGADRHLLKPYIYLLQEVCAAIRKQKSTLMNKNINQSKS